MSNIYDSVEVLNNPPPVKEVRELRTQQICYPKASNYLEEFVSVRTAEADAGSPPPSVKKIYGPVHVTKWKFPQSDTASFKKIVQSGQIKMSRYSVGKIETRNHLVRIPYSLIRSGVSAPVEHHVHWVQFNNPDPWGPPCNRKEMNAFAVTHRVDWNQVMALGDIIDTYNPPWIASPMRSAYEDDINAVKTKVATNLQRRWDVMTDIFETRATAAQAIGLLRAVKRPLETWKKTLEVLKSRKASHKEITSKWLEFRYGIMPVMYSALDLHKELSSRNRQYHTERSQRRIDLSFTPNHPDKTHLYDVRSGEVHIRGTGKAKFESPSARVFHGTSLNVISSAWEVIPYSLIVDWFSNFGDWLYLQTSWMGNLSATQSFCVSVKLEENIETWFRHYRNLSYNVDGWPSLAVSDKSITDHLVKSEVTSTYNRIPFNPSDVSLQLDPAFSNWKRWADAYALSVHKAIRAIRLLK